MELRPRKGRSVQPSTPIVAKPSPRPTPQSSSRKKAAPVPSTPICIPSDDEDKDPNVIRVDPADGMPQEIYADEAAAASIESGDEGTLKQGNQDIIIPDSVEFETPLSSIARLHRAQIKVASSNFKPKTKVTSSTKKKVAEAMNSTPVAETCIVTLEKAGLDEAMAKKVFGAPSEDATSEEIEKQEALTGNVPQKSDEIAVEITLLAQEVCFKKTEVSNLSIDSKQVHSSIRKSVNKRHEEIEVVDTKLDQGGRPEHIVDVDAPIASEPQALSLILSDDEAVQVSDAVRVDRCEEKISASKEAAQEKCFPSAKVSKARRESKKSQFHKEDIVEEESLSRKLFEETIDVTIPCTDTNHDDSRLELGSRENSSKEGMREINSVEVENYSEKVVSTSERHSFKSPSTSLKGREVADVEMLDIDKDKLDASDIGIKAKDIVIDGVQEVSEESSDEAASSGEERDVDINSDHPKLDAATACSQKNAVHDKECRSSDNYGDDDDGNASSGSDDDGDEEDEMASIFFSSMKANLQRMSELSGLSMQTDEQAKQDALVRLESQLTKSAVKKPCANGGLTGYGLSWSPEIALSTMKTSNAQLKKPRNVLEAIPDTIWGKDRCLQDGFCVPPVDPLKLNKLARKQKDDTAGAKWFNLSAPTITPEIKKELQLVKLRGAQDPKRHYKADDSKGLPKYFQVGTVVGGPADFYSGRLTKKEQKSSLASELLSDSSLTAYRKRKYLEIQEQKQAGGKGFWKKKKNKQTPAWAKI